MDPDFGFEIERHIRKRISTLRNLFLDILSFCFFFGEIFERIFKTVLKDSGLARARIIS